MERVPGARAVFADYAKSIFILLQRFQKPSYFILMVAEENLRNTVFEVISKGNLI